MAWQDRYLDASFRGVPFFVDRANTSGGRKTVLHEFPERDLPFAEDLGRASRLFNVTGYIIGEDYFEQRDRLIAACFDKSGPGILIHPYYGSLTVNCQNLNI